MKTTRRFFSMVLALMMVLSLSVTAFADTVIAAPDMQVKVVTSPSGETDAWVVHVNVGETVETALNKVYTPNETIFWKEVKDYNNPEKKHNSLVALGAYESTGFNPENETDVDNLVAHSEYEKEDIADFTWYDGNLQGYGLVNYDENTGVYSYIYAGYDWTYGSNLSPQIWDYMCCYSVKENEEITLTYDFTVSEWTTTTPIV